MRITRRAMKPVEWILLIVLAMLWGTSFFFIKTAIRELPPLTTVLVRLVIAAVLINLLLLLTGQRLPTSLRTWRVLAIMGALNITLPYTLLFYGQGQTTTGIASILNATTPLWGLVMAHVMTRDERLTTNRLAGVLLGLVGVAIMIGPEAVAGSGRVALGQAAILGAALLYAYCTIFGKRLAGVPPFQAAAGQVTCAAVLAVPLSLWLDRPWQLPVPSMRTWMAVAAMAVLSTVVAYVIYFRLLRTAGATNVVLVHLLIPVNAMLLGTQVLGEVVTARDLAGMACIAFGLVIIDGRALASLLAWLSPAALPAGNVDETGS